MLETGRVLKHYEIVRLLGKGGMGEVYVARDQKLGRQVALKVLPDDLASSGERRERFEREARAVAALQHPNIVTLHSIEEVEGLTFMVMELIDGKPLSEAIPRGGLSLDDFLKIAIPLADAVAAAHARGITHRDLKPANALIDGEGRVHVLDFGLAKVTDDALAAGTGSMQPTEALTGEGKIVGTIAYMSPEQVEGRPVDSRSDIFSLGVLFYEMATGARPFEGDTGMSVLTAILRDEPVPVTDRKERLPRYLGRIVKRCLQKAPSRRYQSALDLRNDLADLEEELASGELQTPGASTAAAGGRQRWLRWAVGFVVVLLVGIWWGTRPSRERAAGPSEPGYQIRRLTVRGSPEAVAISPDGRYVVYASGEVGGRSLRLQQVVSGSDIELVPKGEWNVNFRQLAFTSDGEYVRYTQGLGGEGGTLWEVPVLGGPPRRLAGEILIGPAYSPDDRQMAFVSGTEFIERWTRLDLVSIPDGARRSVFELSEEGSDIEIVAWSPDGGRLALSIASDATGDRLTLLSLETGVAQDVPGAPFVGLADICWSPDGERLVVLGRATSQAQEQIWGVDVRSGARSLLVRDFNNYQGCSMTVDGGTLATVRQETHSQIWVVPVDAAADAHAVATTTGRVDGSARIAWLDAGTVVYGAPDGESWNLWKVDTEGGTSVRLSSQGADSPTTSRNGRVAFEAGWEIEGRQGIYGLEPRGGDQQRLSPEGLFADRPTLTPDGDWLFYELLIGDRLQFVRSPWQGGEPEIVTSAQAHLASVSPDGTRVALHVRNPELERWQTAIFPVESQPGELWLDLHSETYSPWAGNDALFISRTTDGVANIFRLRIDSLAEEQVTFFDEGQIFSFDVSPDLTRLAVGRGEVVNDLLLIEGVASAIP